MSRSLGLRDDQREGEMLVMRIVGLFPLDPVYLNREQARSTGNLDRPDKAIQCGSELARDEAGSASAESRPGALSRPLKAAN
jgi:hypothetical protein